MPKIFCWLLATTMSCYLSAQTTVIAVKTKNAIYVGADSRETLIITNKTTNQIDTTYRDNQCKIQKLNKYFIATVHHFGKESIENALKFEEGSSDFNNFMYRYARGFGKFLLDYLRTLKRDNKKYYDTHFLMDSVLCVSVLFGIVNDTSVLHALRFTKLTMENGEIDVNITFFHYNFLAAGKNDEILSEVSNPKTWKKRIVFNIDRLIKIESAAHPKFVGGPINIIKVNKRGHKWVQNPCK